jgi:hypothetical protein
MNNFFQIHYGFILGFVSGMGYLLFCLEASRPLKNPLFYIGGLGLSLICSTVYRKLKRDAAHLSDAAKENSEAKAE